MRECGGQPAQRADRVAARRPRLDPQPGNPQRFQLRQDRRLREGAQDVEVGRVELAAAEIEVAQPREGGRGELLELLGRAGGAEDVRADLQAQRDEARCPRREDRPVGPERSAQPQFGEGVAVDVVEQQAALGGQLPQARERLPQPVGRVTDEPLVQPAERIERAAGRRALMLEEVLEVVPEVQDGKLLVSGGDERLGGPARGVVEVGEVQLQASQRTRRRIAEQRLDQR
ncbi:hypothetical protein Dvina_10935 [Dactylosporangium vinaceum]|uniref:Uncharacterized protein n=1 Tax=Dactylosporangium vinaceum TaxID=53362 RepID=A0ABV5MBT3_9ACTN|nr:hypothetical protein [Dactylosporangium vinaceum]UAB98548.1 hypothetical protein Dvina_10935 [Dactylosporangium vinaceum]